MHEPRERLDEAAADRASWPNIGDYAVIGDCRTVSLISRDGSLDWLCLPHFSGQAIFSGLLDRERGGCFSIRPADAYQARRRYLEDSVVLETTFETATGVLRLIDLMPVWSGSQAAGGMRPLREVLRLIEVVEGTVEVEVLFAPRPNFARSEVRLERRGQLGWACQHPNGLVLLHADLPLEPGRDGTEVRARVRLDAGDKRALSLVYEQSTIAVIPPLGGDAEARLATTLTWWRDWIGRCTYQGPYRDAVVRSALTLKLMTYGISGAVVAAPTSSLPERMGGSLNWDYRYCWLRDASLTLRVFLGLGWPAEADAFLRWLLQATRLTWPELQVCYDVYGETDLREVELDHLSGYRGSKPVRIGNAAVKQLQLDTYGAVVLAAFDFVTSGGQIDRGEARLLRGIGETVCRRWREPDNGLWEVRGQRSHHTYSKLMCWVALDRLLQMHQAGTIRIDEARFRNECHAIRASIEEKGFNQNLNSYVGVFESQTLDASLLLMARSHYVAADDPRMIGTWQQIHRHLDQDGIVLRYTDDLDPTASGEGAFGICSFWAVSYLVRLGETEEATRRFEQLLACANDVGLYGEEIDLESRGALGNFPQAYTHVGLLNAALALEQARTGAHEAQRQAGAA